MDDLDARAIQLIRGFAMDAPRRANSGHPGTAMALAPAAHVLFSRIMRHDPADPHWPDRDRFVLSCGHASILLYSMLYLSGYGLELADLEAFRQWGSHTPGHPEANHGTTGVEVTTGPLGQGFGNSVGMAIAERYLRARFGPDVMDHHTFVLASDGDLMEGLSHEAASLAGHLGLGPAVRRVRRQPHHHRRRHRPRGQRRLRQALRGLRVAHRVPRRDRQRPATPSRRPSGGPWPSRTGRRCSSCAATSATRRQSSPTTPRPTATPSRRRRSAGRRRSSASRPTSSSTPRPTSSTPTAPWRPSAAPRPARPGSSASTVGTGDRERVARVLVGHAAARVGGQAADLRGRRQAGHPPGHPEGHQRHARVPPRPAVGGGRPHGQHRREARRRRAAGDGPRRAAGRSTTASASTPWARP